MTQASQLWAVHRNQNATDWKSLNKVTVEISSGKQPHRNLCHNWLRRDSQTFVPSEIILWRVYPLPGNDSVNTFSRQQRRAIIGRLLLRKESVNTPKTIRDNRRLRFPWGPPRGYITRSSKGTVRRCQKLREFSWTKVHLRELLPRTGSSSGDGSRRWLRQNDKKWIRLCKEHFICYCKLQEDGCKSVASIRLVKTQNPSECVLVKSKGCIRDSAVTLVVHSCECIRYNKSNHPIQNPSYKSCTKPLHIRKFTRNSVSASQRQVQFCTLLQFPTRLYGDSMNLSSVTASLHLQ
jgi:hypothetical protein